MSGYKEKRDLDGVYFRVNRDGKWMDICFSDLTKEERDTVCKGRDVFWLKSLCNILADTIYKMGDYLCISED